MIYINDMNQVVETNLYLFFQNKKLLKQKKRLTENFSNICDWSANNKLSIDFWENKNKSFVFSYICNLKLVEELDIRYKEMKIKQHISL